MKKTYYPMAPARILLFVALIFLWILFCPACIILMVKDENSLYEYIICSIGLIISIGIDLDLYFELRKRIIFYEKEIAVEKDRKIFTNCLQHKVVIPYTEIINLEIMISNRDSKGRSIQGVFTPMPYLVFVCKGGKKRNINLYNYSKKQKVDIVNEVYRRVEELDNDVKLPASERLISQL